MKELLLDWLYPRKCALCGLLDPRPVCEPCEGEMQPMPHPVQQHVTADLAFRAAIYPYNGRPAQAVKRLKYDRATSLAEFLSRQLYGTALDLGLVEDRLIIPVPIHWSRRFSRGFNQAELLCESFPKERVDPSALSRIRATRPQVGLSRDERQRNLSGAFRAGGAVHGRRVLLIDDVLTTGQTARECARVLREAGAIEVGILAFAGDE